MIPKEWLDEYFRKSGDAELLEGKTVLLPFGFVVYRENGDRLVLLHVYSRGRSGRKMEKFIDNLAKMLGKKKIVFATRRKPDGFMRKYKYKLIGYLLEKEVE